MELEKSVKFINQLVLVTVICIPLVFIPVENVIDYFYLPKVLAMFIITCTYFIILIVNSKRLSELIVKDDINHTLLIYAILLMISIFFAQDKYYAIIGYPFRWEGFITICMYMLLFLAARSFEVDYSKIMKGAIIASCIVATYGILQYYGIDPFPRDSDRKNWVRAFSTMGNPNFLGSYIVLMIPLSMHLFIIKKKNYAVIIFVVLLYCLLCTMTRGAWLGALISIGSYISFLWFNRNKYENTFKRVFFILTLALVVVLAFNLQSGNEVLKRFFSITNIVSNGEINKKAGSNRMFIWIDVLKLISMKPFFGFGIENLSIPFSEFFKEDILKYYGSMIVINKAHNEYLHIAVSSGIPSLIAYITFVGFVINKGFKRMKDDTNTLPFMAAVLGYLVQAFFNISVVSVAYLFWIFLGLLAGNKLNSSICNTHEHSQINENQSYSKSFSN